MPLTDDERAELESLREAEKARQYATLPGAPQTEVSEQEQFDLDYPPGSLKRQEYEREHGE